MNITPHQNPLAGLFVRTQPEGASLSVWVGQRELAIELDQAQRAQVADLLAGTEAAAIQIVGAVFREFEVSLPPR
ncbi:hypothetical protein CGK74_14535 [Thauera propionica]|uniref:Uncharacterized protein n=1 Tax=Thauera propionica TaxID=2019431 RepID=A0A235EVQ7_9RHOO|nr:hypothetical protein [Thauera propionica]OYD53061.1 hypothetical protein CGK74_14535 [Thauera propionica]